MEYSETVWTKRGARNAIDLMTTALVVAGWEIEAVEGQTITVVKENDKIQLSVGDK